MRIEVTARGMHLTEPIAEHARAKAEKLPKFFEGVRQINVVIHDAEHESFKVEVILDVVKHQPLVARADGSNVYTCIDQAVEKASRQLHDHKERLRERR